MRIAIIGCGYVADFYMGTLDNHPQLELAGVFDRDGERSARLAAFYNVPRYRSLEDVLDDQSTRIVVNLTNPGSHFEVTRACLEAGKHVYTEKPATMSFAQGQELAVLAENRNLQLSCAPCSILGESAQTIWRALREQQVGRARLVLAELSDGPVHLMHPQQWRSLSGTPWPWEDEFEVGPTLEHAAYYVSWLVAYFGPAVGITSFSAHLAPDKGMSHGYAAPDFSVACIEFSSGVVARLTCDTFAPINRGLRIIGDEGVLGIADCWDYGSQVSIQRRTRSSVDWIIDTTSSLRRRNRKAVAPVGPPLRLRLEGRPRLARWLRLGTNQYPLVCRPTFRYGRGARRMDYARGIAELAAAINEGRESRLSTRFSLHVNEVVLAVHDSSRSGARYQPTTACEPMDPMPWAASGAK